MIGAIIRVLENSVEKRRQEKHAAGVWDQPYHYTEQETAEFNTAMGRAAVVMQGLEHLLR